MPITSTNGVCVCVCACESHQSSESSLETQKKSWQFASLVHWAHNLYLWTVIRLGSSSSSKAAHIIIILSNSSSTDINQHAYTDYTSQSQTNKYTQTCTQWRQTSAAAADQWALQWNMQMCTNQQQTMRDKSTPRYRLFVCVCVWCPLGNPVTQLGSVSIGAHRQTTQLWLHCVCCNHQQRARQSQIEHGNYCTGTIRTQASKTSTLTLIEWIAAAQTRQIDK